MNQNIPLAVVLTVIASVILAISSVVQHTAVADEASPEPGAKLSGGQLLAVIRNPRWLGGLVLAGTGAVVQMAALLLAPVTVVQPIGCSPCRGRSCSRRVHRAGSPPVM